MRILLIEDDSVIANFITKGMKQAGFAIDHMEDGVTGLHAALDEVYDLAIVDLMLPRLDGLNVIDRIREKKINIPIIVLSAKRTVDEKVDGLQHGADDYLTKPFSFSELLARVEALLRRSSNTVEPTSLSIHDLTLDLLARTVERAGRKNRFTTKGILVIRVLDS